MTGLFCFCALNLVETIMQMRNLDAWSNMNEAGVYVFKIGGAAGGGLVLPDVDPLKRT